MAVIDGGTVAHGVTIIRCIAKTRGAVNHSRVVDSGGRGHGHSGVVDGGSGSRRERNDGVEGLDEVDSDLVFPVSVVVEDVIRVSTLFRTIHVNLTEEERSEGK